MRKLIIALGIVALAALPSFARTVTLTLPDGSSWSYDLPDDVANIVDQHKSEIEEKLKENNVTSTQLDNAATEVKKAYDDYVVSSLGTDHPYTVAKSGLNDFADVIRGSLPDAQIQQNVWANSWIGYLVQVGGEKFRPAFGLGLNVGAAKLDMAPLKKTCDAFKISMGGLPTTLGMPTVTVDARLGGVKVNDFELPFDVGFTISTFDSSKISKLKSAIKPVSFDFFAIGFDVRYCVWKIEKFDTRLSVGAGYYYTKGAVNVAADEANAGLEFKSHNFNLNAQISTKLAFFRPFVGARFMFTNTSVDWYAKDINWKNILSDNNENIDKAISYGLLPSKFNGGVSGFKFYPVIQGGFCFDLAVIDLTFSASYDFVSKNYGGAFSLRFSL